MLSLTVHALSIFLNNTTATSGVLSFGPETRIPITGLPSDIEASDLNQDGRMDLVIANGQGNATTAGSLTVLFNTTTSGSGTPTFASMSSIASGSGANAIAFEDFDNDGKTDIVTANYYGGRHGNVSVLLNRTAAASLTPMFTSELDVPTGVGPQTVDVADLNADGRLDIVAGNVVLFGVATAATTPRFALAQQLITLSGNISEPLLADLNLDGMTDLALHDGFTLSTFFAR